MTVMSADQLIQYLAWILYLLIFASVVGMALRRPVRANIDIALFFVAPTGIIVSRSLINLGLLQPGPLLTGLTDGLLLALPVLLLRIVDDFAPVRRWLPGGAALAAATLTIAVVVAPPRPPGWLVLAAVVYLVGLLAYVGVAFWREAARAGVTGRRMRAAAAGTAALMTEILLIGLTTALPAQAALWRPLVDLAGLASSVFYYLGFAPPALLRRAWQEPELRAFLGRAAQLPRLPDTGAILRAMEAGAAAAVGAPAAAIGLWDAEAGILRFTLAAGPAAFTPERLPITGRAFQTQVAQFTPDLQQIPRPPGSAPADPHTRAVLVAPITAGEKRLGVLSVYAPRAPIFADEDLALIQLLADQAAVVLESRALIDEAAHVRAREEVARLKEDFLSAAAHDLKTPLTTIVGLTQLMERRALRDPSAPADLATLRKLGQETQRLRSLVLELLDAARAEQGRLVGLREPVDLVAMAREICARHTSPAHPCRVEAAGPATGEYDPTRIGQLLENLIENAVKYSPGGGPVEVRIWREGRMNHLTVRDHGIGIPAADLPHLFERFHRGSNVDDRHFAGMGLGLYICRGITEQHGGTIHVSSTPQDGTTFHLALPAGAAPPAADSLRPGTIVPPVVVVGSDHA